MYELPCTTRTSEILRHALGIVVSARDKRSFEPPETDHRFCLRVDELDLITYFILLEPAGETTGNKIYRRLGVGRTADTYHETAFKWPGLMVHPKLDIMII